jgi:hypothetical protein
MPTSQKVVTQAWEGIIVVEVAHAVAVFAAEASTQEAATAWESTAALVRDVEAQAALAGREAWERVSRVEVESTAMLASACGEADDLTWRIALLEGELAEAREARDTAEENSCLM